jgi:hydroxymethylbilane synthase
MKRKVIVGTRGSLLALAQAEMVLSRLRALYSGISFEIKKIKTRGDRIQSSALRKVGKGIFVKELEKALLKKEIDLAIHSLKDVPTQTTPRTTIGAILEREDPRDAFVSRYTRPLNNIPPGSTIGTSSLRRQAQLRYNYNNLNIVDLRGNIDTRLAKLRAPGSKIYGIVVSMAALKRLNIHRDNNLYIQPIPLSIMVPTPAQGAICIQIREKDARSIELVSPLHHLPTAVAVETERRLLAMLEGGCNVPLGIHAEPQEDGYLTLTAALVAPDGSRQIKVELTGSVDDPYGLCKAVEIMLKSQGPLSSS